MKIVIGKTGDPDFCAVTELQVALETRFGGTPNECVWDQSEPLFCVNGYPLTKRRSAGTLRAITESLGWNPKEYG